VRPHHADIASAGHCSGKAVTSLTTNDKTETVAPARHVFGRRDCNQSSFFAIGRSGAR
jgi:hypothetical protein